MNFNPFKNSKVEELTSKLDSQQAQIDNYAQRWRWFDGEKNLGELGAPEEFIPDYYSASARGWKLQITNGLSKLMAEKWQAWVVGKGMRFNAEPILKGISDKKLSNTVENIEYLFRTTCNSRYSDHSSMQNFHQLCDKACLNSYVAGDVLVIFRIVDGRVTTQLIDGTHVDGQSDSAIPVNNYIIDGVEFNSKGRQVAYHVNTKGNKIVRVKAYDDRTGLRYAVLVYWKEPRVGDARGIAASIQDFEKLSKLDRYQEATVGNAELSSSLAATIEHGNSSTGEDPISSAMRAKTYDPNEYVTAGRQIKQALGVNMINMPVDSKLVLTKPNAESLMPDFVDSAEKGITSSEGIPHEVAKSQYGSNYSASRAAIKDWEYNLSIKREKFAIQLLKPYYELCLWVWQTTKKINIEGFETAILNRDYISQEAIFKCRFTGANVPSIDPLKEVKAVRAALGDETTPLMTLEDGTDIISGADYSEVQARAIKEHAIAYKKPIEDGNKTD